MKKNLIIATICLLFVMFTNAQNSLQNNLATHINYLASDNMKGRSFGSKETQLAIDYVKQQILQMGLQIFDFTIVSDSLFFNNAGTVIEDDYLYDEAVEKAVDADTSVIYHNFYTVIPAQTHKYGEEYLYLSTNVNGLGIGTIKGLQIIKNSANNNASSVAVLTELVRFLSSNRHLLQRDIVVMFTDNSETENTARYFAQQYNKGICKMAVMLDNMGYLGYDEDENKYTYSVSSLLENAGNILQPILMKDINVPTFVDYDVWDVPYGMRVSGNFLSAYDDVTDSLQYDNMVKITKQLQEVITAFDTAEIKLSKQAENGGLFSLKDSYLPDNSFLTSKQRSYFGINLMTGSNKHYYSKGKMTGKAAMSYSAGFFYKYQFANRWALKLDANYERAYANRQDGRFVSNVLSIPLSLVNSAGTKSFEIMYGLGAYYDRTLFAQLNKQDVDWDLFNKEEWGWQFTLSTRIGHLLIGYYQKMGISDMMTSKYPHKGKIKNRNMYFTLGWAF